MFPYIQIILPSYTVLAVVGGFAAVVFLYLRSESYGIDFTFFLKEVLLCTIGCLIGGKLFFAVTQIPWLIENFSLRNLLLLVPESGLVFYGGLFGVIFTLYFSMRKDLETRDNFIRFAVPAFPLFHAFGRIGCFMAGCCYGFELAQSVNFFGIEFTRFPVQLLEAVLELVIFLILLVLERKNRELDILAVYLFLYAVIRFLDEFLRGDEVRGIYFGLSFAQWISLGIMVWIVLRKIVGTKAKGSKTAVEEKIG